MFALRAYQQEAVNRILKMYHSDSRCAQLVIPAGAGKINVFIMAIYRLIRENENISIACIFNHMTTKSQFSNSIETINSTNALDIKITANNLTLLTISEYRAQACKNICYDLVICFGTDRFPKTLLKELNNSDHRFILTVSNQPISDINIPIGYEVGYSDFYGINERVIIDSLIIPILKNNGYNILSRKEGKLASKFDVTAIKNDFKYYFEIKSYRNKGVTPAVVNRAIDNIASSEQYLTEYNKSKFVLIILASVSNKHKADIYKEYGIEIWDIHNIIHLCLECNDLYDLLVQVIPYNINDVKPVPITFWSTKKHVNTEQLPTTPIIDDKSESEEERLIERLRKCQTGRENKASIEYEKFVLI